MPRLKLFIVLALFLSQLAGATSLSIRDNSDIALTLSKANYNRLVVKNDKIVEAVFPPNAMGVKRDEQDGSVYIMLASPNPFTLFLTTETGRHFSVTVNGEESLGKTIELIPQSSPPIKRAISQRFKQDPMPNKITAFINSMEHRKPVAGIKVKQQFGKVERLQGGLSLIHKESWEGKELAGEIIEIYNGASKPLNLSASWFANQNIKAVKLSQSLVAPKSAVTLYRVAERVNG